MSIHAVQRGQFRRGQQQTLREKTWPAPTQGMDTRQNLANPPPQICIYSYNMNASEYGMTVRQGYRQWQAGVDNGASTGILTLIPFDGDESDGASDKLFACNIEGIWDVTVDGGSPVLSYTFPNQSAGAGYGVYTAYTTDAGQNVLFYADRINGLVQYDPIADSWSVPSITGDISATEVVYVVTHKQRIWLCARDSAVGYYLGVGAIAGAVTAFSFGSKFKHGGNLVGLYNWTVDGGDGVDDYLVAVSRAGDVLPYRGSDPSQPDWSNVGVYFIGQIPKGNKISAEYGGDLIFLSEFGVTAMSDLLVGSSARDITQKSVTFRIANLIRADLLQLGDQDGWELRYIPSQGLLIVNLPQRSNSEQIQYVLSRTTEGWTFWRGVPMLSVENWRGRAVFGTATSTIEYMDVARDGIIGTMFGRDIEFSILMNYDVLGTPSRFKRLELIRPTFIGNLAPSFDVQALYDYDIRNILLPLSSPLAIADTWDSGIWDSAIWVEGGFTPSYDVRGGLGIGRSVSVAMTGRAITETIFVAMDVMWRDGGVL